MDTLGEKIKRLRTQENMTQEELAQRLGVARATVASWEINRREPDYATLRKIASIFGVTIDYLLNHENQVARVDAALKDDPELLEFWQEVKRNPNLILILKGLRNAPDKDIRKVIQLIKIVREEESRES